MRVRGFRYGGRVVVVGLMVATTTLSVSELAAQQKKDDPPRFGNGVLLRRIFGESESPKATAPKPKPAERMSLEASRQRLKEDTDKLKDKLGLGSNRDPGNAVAQGRISDQGANVTPRTQFAPQASARQTLSDYGDVASATAPQLHFGNPQPAGSQATRAMAASAVPVTPPKMTPPPTWRPDVPGRPENSVMEVGPRNQPRVPAQPTRAVVPPSGQQASAISGQPERADATPDAESATPTTFGAFGIIVDPKAAGPGLTIRAVRPKSIAATIGLKSGDILKNVAGLDIGVVQEIDSLVEVLEPDDEFEITFIRQGKPQTQTFSVPQK
jgi:hypothetical protein